MSKYTTGEVAKICNVTVRTVQYYDNRGILIPSELSEGGRRLYSEQDLQKMKIICFLRNMDLSIDNISKLLKEENSTEIVNSLLTEHIKELDSEIKDKEAQLKVAKELKKQLSSVDNFSVGAIKDVANIMENKAKLKKLHLRLLAFAIVLEVIETGTFVYGWITKNWIPFAIGFPFVLILSIVISRDYFTHTAYICPECHEVFVPDFWKAFWANHTPRTRKLTCPHCNTKSFCIETYNEESEK